MTRLLAIVVPLLLPGCYWISEADLAERLDGDGDGVPRPEDCDDDDPALAQLSTFFTDADGDGYGDGAVQACGLGPGLADREGDCDDGDASRAPDRTETCNGVDDDCDDEVDEGVLQTFHPDIDGDGYGDMGHPILACQAPSGAVTDASDCNDDEALIHPGATEQCDTVDNDCDGLVDDADPELARFWYFDGDGDGFGDAALSIQQCLPPAHYVSNALDCDDVLATRNPLMIEVCNGADDDCDGTVDQGAADASTFWDDDDADGAGDPNAPVRACQAPAGTVPVSGDCDDSDTLIRPGAQEVCDGVDNDCDALIDADDPSATDAVLFGRDADGDGAGDPGDAVRACTAPSGFVADLTDCDDDDNTRLPGADEICDGVDNDCDGLVDDDDSDRLPSSTTAWFLDQDGDGFGDGASVLACTAPVGRVATDGDCDDADPFTFPGAIEQCDTLDNDCDTVADEDVVPTTWYLDGDGDGVGGGVGVTACLRPDGHVPASGDCNDADPSVSPALPEICSGQDDDCDLLVDADDPDLVGPLWYRDLDGDGYGDPALITVQCAQPSGFVANAGDCGDDDPNVNPAAPEVCGGRDDDCDRRVDEADDDLSGQPTWHADQDGDGFGDPGLPTAACLAPPGYVDNGLDCADTGPGAALIRPGAHTEPADVQDGIDRDCDGFDECLTDQDDDGYGLGIRPDDGDGVCNGPQEAALDGDCDDLQLLAHPGAPLIVGDGLDNDCTNGEECYLDLDGDRYGSGSFVDDDGDGSCTDPGESPVASDCADDDATVFPDAPEQCDGLDNDCDGTIDDDVADQDWYTDADGDGFGDAVAQTSCLQPSGTVATGGDCDDTQATIYPGAGVVASDVQDGTDRNCDGVDECFFDGDGDGSGTGALIADDGDGSCNGTGEAPTSGDCDDDDPLIHPGLTLEAVHVGDGLDSDCDGLEECFADEDGDGFGGGAFVADSGDGACNDPGEAAVEGDCDDLEPSVNPGVVPDTGAVADGIDADCDGHDECLLDSDDDQVGVQVVVPGDGVVDACAGPMLASVDGDCDDSRADVYTGAPGVVGDGIDQDCDGRDECYGDTDQDGYGTDTLIADDGNGSCTNIGEAALSGDCDDAVATVFPGAPAVVADGTDQDCDGLEECYADLDGDSFAGNGTTADDGNGSCVDPGEGSTVTDCLDEGPEAAATHPGAVLVPADVADGLDRDCDGYDECFADGDGDGSGAGFLPDDGDGLCTATGEALVDGDCDDADSTRSPTLTELCANGIDDDCDDLTDGADTDGTPVATYLDEDADGFGLQGTETLACDLPADRALVDGDCDDTEPTVNPGELEVCGDGLDNDCDGGPGDCALSGAISSSTLAVWLAPTDTDASGATLVAGDFAGVGMGLAFGNPFQGGTVDVVGAPVLIGGDLAVDSLATLSGPSNAAAATTLAALPDANADGAAELVIGAPGFRTSGPPKGAVILIPSAPTDLALVDAPLVLQGPNSSLAGSAVAVLPDLEGDGVDWIAVGAPSGEGTVYLVADPFSNPGELETVASHTFVGQAQDRVGSALAKLADTDGDGAPELLVGATGVGQNGAAWLIRNPLGALDLTEADVFFQAPANGAIGSFLADVGDTSGDGLPDVAILDAGNSRLHLIDDLTGSTAAVATFPSITGVGPDSRALGGIDLNGDGATDLVVGDPDQDVGPLVGAGRVAVFYGPIGATRTFASADLLLEGTLAAGAFGTALETEDFDGDGRPDLVMGSPGETAAAYVLDGRMGL